MRKAGLVFVFNHRFEKNVPKLKAYYLPRFSNLHFLMPFYSGCEVDITRVIENGWSFSGHIAQGAASYNVPGVTHYVFLGDDLILNPSLDQSNLPNLLNLEPGAGYIKSLVPADNIRFRWPWAIYATRALQSATFNYRSELPEAGNALQKFSEMGLAFNDPRPNWRRDRKWLEVPMPHTDLRSFHRNLYAVPLYISSVLRHISSIGHRSPYPILAGYSDFVVVPAESVQLFAHYCGVFAAMNIFAEIAVPTALALACSSVQTELPLNEHFMDKPVSSSGCSPFHGTEIWDAEVELFCKKYDYSWSRLIGEFPPNNLYYHPVKLSMWK
jgi:hypothetical protein